MVPTSTERNLALELYSSMYAVRCRHKTERWRGYPPEVQDLRDALMQQWAKSRGVIKAAGDHDWRRLIGKKSTSEWHYGGLPGDDHVTMWRKPTDKGRKISIWVSQPYPLSSETLREMADFANRNGLDYMISAWPAWHNPGSVVFVEWTMPEKSDAQRTTAA